MSDQLGVLTASLLIFCMPLAATQNQQSSGREDSQMRARELWNQAVTAKGGRKRLRRIASLYVTANLGDGFREDTFCVFPDYRFEYTYWPSRERTDLEVANARLGTTWWQVDGLPARVLRPDDDDAYLMLLPQILYLTTTKEMDPTPLRSRKAWLGVKRVDVVEVDAKGWRVDYYLDPKTHLPVRVVLHLGPRARANGEMDQQVLLEDYAELDGVMMPHKASYSFTTSPQRKTEHLNFEIDPQYDKGIFEHPPTPKMGPESWRLRKDKM